MRRVLLTAACVVGLLAAVPATGSAYEYGPDTGFWGVHPFDRPTLAETQLMRETGVGMIRAQFMWRGIEEQRPSAIDNLLGRRHYDWLEMDRWVGNAARAGIRIHATLIGSPGWLTNHHEVTPARTDEGRTGWRHFVRAVVGRYGRSGSFWAENPGIPRFPLETFMVWNEQNSAARYRPRPNVREYATLLRIAASEIRAADPRARVVLGGMFGTPLPDGSIDAWDFLRELYGIPGAREHFDAVGVHPYAPNLRGIRYQIRQVRRVMREAQDGATPIEITELGWSSGRSDAHFFFQGPQGQARMLRRSFRLLLRNRDAWRVERIVWLAWRDTQARERCGYCPRFGLVKQDLSPKPSYAAYRAFVNGADRSQRPRRGGRR